ncbi:transcriptional regulator, TetR family [Streptomyces sp. yr375]|uniref:TetR/AcrR family transcriptional regulator n=1 Tax=Streptomyces sp. yr375 TaxID=1761906 RepID=UPI0008CA162A|nr:TetR/AcrR family transcriptional regulator [Streptomyces sp. yr375]SEP77504.1 transcriptional regulator, TetR family [Streptomyces sp. yr375]
MGSVGGDRSYPKGLAKREEILATALEVIAEHGFGGATLRELAEASNLSITGLVHHFGTKEHLLVEVLRRRDEIDADAYDTDRLPDTAATMIERLAGLVDLNAAVPGLVTLYTNLAADAAAPAHPAHAYFRERYDQGRSLGRDSLSHLKERGELPDGVDPDDLAHLLIAAVDGLQLLWQYDKSIDMTRGLKALGTLLELANKAAPSADT